VARENSNKLEAEIKNLEKEISRLKREELKKSSQQTQNFKITREEIASLGTEELKILEQNLKEGCGIVHTMLLEKIEEELKEAKEAAECCICMAETVDTIFMPCMHMICCNDCALKIGQGGSCPKCRQTVANLAKVFK